MDFTVLVIVIITGLTSPSGSGKWHSPSNSSDIDAVHNGTNEEPFMLGAIGQYGSNRNTIGVDKTGHIKTKWYVCYDRVDMFYKHLFLNDMNI